MMKIFRYLLVISLAVQSFQSWAQFTGQFAPENWTLTSDNGNGAINLANVPEGIQLVGGNNSQSGNSDYTVVVQNSGTITFSWFFFSASFFEYGQPGYLLNNNFVGIGDGSFFIEWGDYVEVAVNAGDKFGFRIHTPSSSAGPNYLSISEFGYRTGAQICTQAVAASIGANNVAADNTPWMWFTYTTPPGNKVLSITSSSNEIVELYKGTCSNLQWIKQDTSNISWSTEPNTFLLFRWRITHGSDFTWNLEVRDPGPGETCALAKNASEGINETPSAPHWFRYVVPALGNVTISSVGHTNTDTYLEVYDACGGDLIAANDDHTGLQSNVMLPAVAAGTELLIHWADVFSSDGFSWTISFSNDGVDCAHAVVAVEGTNHSPRQPYWFKYTVPYDTAIVISSVAGGLYPSPLDTYLFVYDGCSGNLIASSDDYNSLQSQVTIDDLLAGQELIIFWSGEFSSASFDWSLRLIGKGENCEIPITATAGVNHTAETSRMHAIYRFKMPDGAAKKLVIDSSSPENYVAVDRGPCNKLKSSAGGWGQLRATDLDPGEEVTITWYLTEGSAEFDWTITVEDLVPGDNCTIAVAVDEGPTTIPFTSSYVHWFTFTMPPEPGKKIVVAAPGVWVQLYTNKDCNNPTWNTDAAGNGSALMSAPPGANIHILLVGYIAEDAIMNVIIEDENAGIDCDHATTAEAGINFSSGASVKWFRIILPPGPHMKVQVSGDGFYFEVFSGTCDNLVSHGQGLYPRTFAGFQPEQEIYVRWFQQGYSINWSLEFIPVVEGEICEKAVSAREGLNIFNGIDNKFWYSFTMPEFSEGRLRLSAAAQEYHTVKIYTGTCDNLLLAASGNGDISLNAAASEKVLIEWESTLDLPWDLSIEDPSKLSQKISFDNLASVRFGDPPFDLSAFASSDSGLPVSFISQTDTIISVTDGSTATITGAGRCLITAQQAGDSQYNSARLYQWQEVDLRLQTIFFAAMYKTSDGAPFKLNAASDSGLPLTYTSLSEDIVKIKGDTATLVGGIGEGWISAYQAGNSDYAAQEAFGNIIVKHRQIIHFDTIPLLKNRNDPAFTISATASSGLDVVFSITNPQVATIENNVVTIVGKGTTGITAYQTGNDTYYPAEPVERVMKVKGVAQSISFDSIPAIVKFKDPPLSLKASSSSGLPVTFYSNNPSVAVVSGDQLTVTGVGTALIIASQSGDDYFDAADSIQTLIVSRADQFITFDSLAEKSVDDYQFVLDASSSSALPVHFKSSDESVALVSNKTITLVGGGSAEITAYQDGDLNYSPAPHVTRILVVKKLNPLIYFDSIPDKTAAHPPFTIGASSSSGYVVTFSKLSDNFRFDGLTQTPRGIATIIIFGPGRAKIKASLQETSRFKPVEKVRSFCVIPPRPEIELQSDGHGGLILMSDAPEGNRWYHQGQMISTEKYIPVAEVGTYKVQVEIDDCKSDFSSSFEATITAVENEADKISLYPNPAHQLLTLTGLPRYNEKVMIMDVTGRERNFQATYNSNHHVVDISELAAGVYYVRIISNKGLLFLRFLKN